jgi:indole-3-glycerol phosphate synthase
MITAGDTILAEILQDVKRELAAARQHRPLPELQRMIRDARPVRSLRDSLKTGFGLIAEIKQRSPSQGAMRPQNVADAPAAYQRSPLVRGISVLTNSSHFGMSMERLQNFRSATTKPVLRKDFLFDEYQVYEARAFGADAILLMANLLEADEMRRLYGLARELKLEALFECHTREQIQSVPPDACLYGINSRSFAAGAGAYTAARQHRQAGGHQDLTTDLSRFNLVQCLPSHAVRIAESGVSPATVAKLRDELGYDAALVGTSLLLAPAGIDQELQNFERALAAAPLASSARP